MSNGQTVWPPAFGLPAHPCHNCPVSCARTLSEALMELAEEGDLGTGVRAKVDLPGELLTFISTISNFLFSWHNFRIILYVTQAQLSFPLIRIYTRKTLKILLY